MTRILLFLIVDIVPAAVLLHEDPGLGLLHADGAALLLSYIALHYFLMA